MLKVVFDYEEELAADTVLEMILSITPHPHDENWLENISSQVEGTFAYLWLEVESLLKLSPGTYPDKVKEYEAKALTSSPPPIVLVQEYGSPDSGYVLLDGAHRLLAAHRVGHTRIDAYVQL